MHNILLVGAGQIGSRHLQGLMKTGLQVKIGVVEPDKENLKNANKRLLQVEPSMNVKEVLFWESIKEVTFSEVDLAIIATNSDVRPEVINQLVQKLKVHNMILEKVVFQSLKIFKQQIRLLESNNINSWVNCPRRIYPFYKKLKDELKGGEKISITVSGSNWGIGCNSLHFIDLFYFLTSEKECRVDYTSLDLEILQSKRKGFVEFTGRIGFSNRYGHLHLQSFNYNNLPLQIDVVTSGRRWLISESQGNMICFSSKNNFRPDIIASRFPYQSELTHLVADDIISKGECGLVGLEESLSQHSAILPVFIGHIHNMQGIEIENCPIT